MEDTATITSLGVIILRLYSLVKQLARMIMDLICLGISLPEVFKFDNNNTGK